MSIFGVHRKELPALVWAAAWFFCVLGAYYTIRPVRETFAAGLDGKEKANLFTMALVVMLIATPLYGFVVSRVARRWLVPIVYGFFITHLIGFWWLLSGGEAEVWVSKAFFVWISVFNLFIVTLFWGTVVDLFNGGQGKRLFGFIFGAGTLGQLISSWGVQASAEKVGIANLLWVCMALLTIAIVCSWNLRRLLSADASQAVVQTKEFSWSAIWQGVTAVGRSPYLLGITGFIIASSVCATVVYFQMTDIVREQIDDPAQRTAWFAKVNKTHAIVTLLMQTALVGWLLRKIGVGLTLALVPATLLVGFVTLSLTQTLVAVGAFQVALRAAAFSLGNPALEVLFTAVAPEQKYRAKAFIDTVGKRTGDVLGAQTVALLGSLGWMASTMSMAMLPIALGLVVLCVLMGLAHQNAVAIVSKQTKNTIENV